MNTAGIGKGGGAAQAVLSKATDTAEQLAKRAATAGQIKSVKLKVKFTGKDKSSGKL